MALEIKVTNPKNTWQEIAVTKFLPFKLKSNDKSLSLNEINDGLLDTYIQDNYQTNKRLAEQIYLGNILEYEKNYTLTSKGKNLIRFYKNITKYFNLDNIIESNY